MSIESGKASIEFEKRVSSLKKASIEFEKASIELEKAGIEFGKRVSCLKCLGATSCPIKIIYFW